MPLRSAPLAIAVLGLLVSVIWPSVAAGSFTQLPTNIMFGGRAVALDVDPANTNSALAASESGGLYSTASTGASWSHVDSLTPFRLSDVKYVTSDGSRVVVTAWTDSRTVDGGGIWLSVDGGTTWTKPPSSVPPGSPCPVRVNMWGIATDLNGSVYVGTDCGLAVSRDSGSHWHYSLVGAPVYAAAALAGGIVNICASDGVHRSIDRGRRFTGPLGAVASCTGAEVHATTAIALARKLILVTDRYGNLYESDDAGTTFTNLLGPVSATPPREPFVRARALSDNTHFVVFYSNGLNVYRQTCSILASPHCVPATSAWTFVAPGHADTNDLAFQTQGGTCAGLLATDGGVGVSSPSSCGAAFAIAPFASGFHALQVYSSASQARRSVSTHIYFGTQDNSIWASGDGGISWPASQSVCCEGDALSMLRFNPGVSEVVTGWTCWPCAVYETGPLLSGEMNWPSPAGSGPGAPSILAAGEYLETVGATAPSTALDLTPNTGMSWAPETTFSAELRGSMAVSGTPRSSTVYQGYKKPGSINGHEVVGLLQVTGLGSGGPVAQNPADSGIATIAQYCMGQGTWECPPVLGVDPNDPNHVMVADTGSQQMMVSRNGGASWNPDASATSALLGAGTFLFNDQANNPGVGSQAHVIAFDPFNPNIGLIGSEANGLTATADGGTTWAHVADSELMTGISDIWFPSRTQAFVSTYGRGIWEYDFNLSTPRLYVNILCLSGPCNNPFNDPSYCPACDFNFLMQGDMTDLTVDKRGRMSFVAIDNGTLVETNNAGKYMTPTVPQKFNMQLGSFTGCPGCLPFIKTGGNIRGFISLNHKVQALITSFEALKLGGAHLVAHRGPGATLPRRGPHPASGQGPYVQLVGMGIVPGETIAPYGQDLLVYGSGWCSSCGPVTISVDGVPVLQAGGSGGSFVAKLAVTQRPGYHRLAAMQSSGKLFDIDSFIVPILDSAKGSSRSI